jgi:hypothetical protein
MHDSGSFCGPSETPYHPGMEDLLLYGMQVEMLTVDEKSGKPVRARIDPRGSALLNAKRRRDDRLREHTVRVPYLSMNTDIPNRGETRYESDKKAELARVAAMHYGGDPVTGVHITEVSPPLDKRQEFEEKRKEWEITSNRECWSLWAKLLFGCVCIAALAILVKWVMM